MSRPTSLNPCGHEAAPDEPFTCLVKDEQGSKHRVSQVAGRHCICHGFPITKIEGWKKR